MLSKKKRKKVQDQTYQVKKHYEDMISFYEKLILSRIDKYFDNEYKSTKSKNNQKYENQFTVFH